MVFPGGLGSWCLWSGGRDLGSICWRFGGGLTPVFGGFSEAFEAGLRGFPGKPGVDRLGWVTPPPPSPGKSAALDSLLLKLSFYIMFQLI